MTDHGTFSVWAPTRGRVRLVVDGDGGGVVDLRRGIDGWWSPLELPPRALEPDADYGFVLDDDPHPYPDPRSRRQPGGVHELSRTYDASSFAVARPGLDRAAAGRLGGLRAPHRHVHAGGTLDARDRATRPPSLARRRPGRGDAGQRLQRHPQLGLRRGRLVRGHRAVRRPTGVPALRRRLPRRRARRRAGRRLQPPRPVGELPAAVRALPQAGSQHLGRPGQPRRRGLGRGPAVRPRQRPDVVRGLPRRRAAARRRARPGRHLAGAHPRGDGDRDRRRCPPTCAGR